MVTYPLKVIVPLAFLGFHGWSTLAALLTIFLLQFNNFVGDPGVGWHLKTGELILNSLQIPQVDPFLTAPLGTGLRSWVSDQWLSDVFLYLLIEYAGWDLAYTFFAALYLWTFFVILDGTCFKSIGHPLASTIAVVLAFKMGQVHFIFRPVVFAFPCFALVHRWSRQLTRVDDSTGLLKLRGPFSKLALVFLLWTNLHPSFMLGLIWLLLVPLSYVLVCGVSALLSANLYRLLTGIFGCFLITLINPYGFNLHLSVLDLANDPFFMNFHSEWLSPNFNLPEGQLLELILGIFIVSLIIVPNTEKPIPVYDILSLLIGAHLSLGAVRVLPFCGIAAAPAVVWAISRLAQAIFGQFEFIYCGIKSLASREGQDRKRYSISAVIILIPVVYTLITRQMPIFQVKPGISEKSFPVAALDFLQAQGIVGTIVSVPEWGGYITWRGFPKLRAIVDDRNTLLGSDFYKEYFAKIRNDLEVSLYINSFGSEYILLPITSEWAKRMKCQDGFDLLYQDQLAQIYFKRK